MPTCTKPERRAWFSWRITERIERGQASKFGRGYGSDTIQENDTFVGQNDIVKFLSGVAAGQIWLRHVGNHLEASIIGIADKLMVQDWYSGEACQIEQFQTADGKILLNIQVEALVSAMVSFTPMALGKTTLPADEQMALATVRDARWWTAED